MQQEKENHKSYSEKSLVQRAAADLCQPTNRPGAALCLPVLLQVGSDNPSLTGLATLCSTNPLGVLPEDSSLLPEGEDNRREQITADFTKL